VVYIEYTLTNCWKALLLMPNDCIDDYVNVT